MKGSSARHKRFQTEKTRDKIRTTELKNRLEAYALGQIDPNTGEPLKLEPAQVKAIQVLLAKTLPDLSASDITHHEPEQSLQEKFQALVNQVGEKQARLIYPDLADKFLGVVQPTHTQPGIAQ